MKEYQQRVIKERDELEARANVLNQFIGYDPKFDDIDSDERERMKVQLDLMWSYFEVLTARIANFKN